MKAFLYSLKTWFHRSKMEASMKEEMQQHIELQAAEFEEQGLSKSEALRKARKAFGNQTHLQESCRASWGVRLVDELTNDISFAARQLKKHPLFTTTAILSLGIGIGVNLTLFNALNALMFKTLDLEHPEQLYEINTITPNFNGYTSGRMDRFPDGSIQFNALSYSVYQDFRNQAKAIADVFCWMDTFFFIVETNQSKHTDSGLIVSDNYFESLGIKALMGSFSLNEASGDDASRTTWISESFWKSEFSSDPEVVGKTVRIEGNIFTIKGVLPSGFSGLEKRNAMHFFFPLASLSVFEKFHDLNSPEHHFLKSGLRLKNSLYKDDLQLLLSETLSSADIPFQPGKHEITPKVLLIDASCGIQNNILNQSQNLKIPLMMSGVLLLVSCINLAGLQFSRHYRRTHEFNIRTAVGASRSRLIRQMLTETLLLCFAGAANALILSIIGHKWLNIHFVRSIGSIDSTPDIRMLGIYVALISICTVLVGLYPALRVTRLHHNLHNNQKSGPISTSFWVSKTTVAIQIVCAVTLIYTAFLFGKTLHNLYHKDLGFDPSSLLLFSLEGKDFEQSTESKARPTFEVLETLKNIPGIEAVACTSLEMLSRWTTSSTLSLSMFDPSLEEEILTYRMEVSPTFFQTLNIPMLLGESYDPTVRERNERKVIISQSLAEKAFPGKNPVGRTFDFNRQTWTVIGVCADIQYHSVRSSSKYLMYTPLRGNMSSYHMPPKYYYLRTDLSPEAANTVIQKTLRIHFPSMFVEGMRSFQDNVDHLIYSERNITLLSTLFSTITIALICVGLFAQTSFEAASRTHEIGVRLTMGATPKSIVMRMLKRSISPVMIGVFISLPIAAMVKQAIDDSLYEISPIEPMALLYSILLIFAISLLAVLAPAIRSSRLDPMRVLRSE